MTFNIKHSNSEITMPGREAYLCVRVSLVMLCTCRLHLVTIVNRFAPSELFVGVKINYARWGQGLQSTYV